MNPELDKQLCAKYPKIFQDRHKPMSETCMCWGLEVGDGWYTIIDGLCTAIQSHIDYRIKEIVRIIEWNKDIDDGIIPQFWNETVSGPAVKKVVPEQIEQVIAVQVKEKFGTLRFYVYGGDDTTHNYIALAEITSGVTCEICGKSGSSSSGGWIKTLCKEHEEGI
jgi:hypothetical protein